MRLPIVNTLVPSGATAREGRLRTRLALIPTLTTKAWVASQILIHWDMPLVELPQVPDIKFVAVISRIEPAINLSVVKSTIDQPYGNQQYV